MKKLHLIAALSAFGMFGMGSVGFDWDRFLNALQRVESGGEKNPDQAVGDNGRSRGAYQLGKLYVKDAQSYNKELRKYTYEEIVSTRSLGGDAVIAYLYKYGKKHIESENVEALAGMHNGGNKNPMRKATENYRKKFMREYNR